MAQRNFRLRLSSRYQGEKNEVSMLNVELLHDGNWEPFTLDVETPGFLIFVYAIFTCQHLYLRANAAEHGIFLDSATGSINVTTNEDWQVETSTVEFNCQIRTGQADNSIIDHIISRMQACPVSLNIRPEIDVGLTMV